MVEGSGDPQCLSERDIAFAWLAPGLDLAQIIVRDLDGTIRLWTRGMEDLYGFTSLEAIGKQSHRLLRTRFPVPLEEIEARLLADESWSGELHHTRRDGVEITVSTRWALGRNRHTHDLIVSEVNHDITELRRVRDRQALLADVIDNSQDAIVIKQLDGTITNVNKAAETMFGYVAEELVGKSVSVLFPPDRINEEEVIISRIERGERVDPFETRRRRKDGTEFDVSVSISPVHDASGRITGAAKIARNLSQQIAERRRLQELQAELIHVSRLSTVGQMATTLAHELNQPLTAVMNYAESALRMVSCDDPGLRARCAETLEKVVAQSARAGKIIQRLREFVARRKVRAEYADINKVVEEGCSLALVGANQMGTVIDLALEPAIKPVLIDTVQIQQVLLNLVRNALEAMAESEVRYLKIGTRAQSGPQAVEVTVEDTGSGLSEEAAQRLFQPFVTTKPTGMGLGLSICREIIEAHGGRLWATPRRGGGTTFHFTLGLGQLEPLA